jgi:hypothetical protein
VRIKIRPLLIAAGAGAAVMIIVSLISNVIQYLASPGLFNPNAGSFAVSTAGWVVSCLSCLCVPILDAAVGFFYAYLFSREAPLTLSNGLLGGALAGALEGIVGSLFGLLVSAVVLPAFLGQAAASAPPEFGGVVIGAGLVGGALGSVWGICLGVLRGAVIALIGGAIGFAVFKPKTEVPPVSVPPAA